MAPLDTRLAPQAYEQVLEMILSGDLPPGTLVNERRLAEQLGMSRTPVRDALLVLETEGLLQRQGSRGLQVTRMRVEDYIEALQVRMLLEPPMARMAAGRIDQPALGQIAGRLQALLERDPETGRERAEVREVDDMLHGAIAEAAGNNQLSGIIRTLRRQTQVFDLKSLPERLEDTCREHLEIVERVGLGDGDGAAQAMLRHLEAVKQSIIRRLTGA